MGSIARGFLIIGGIGIMSSGAYSVKVINNLPPHYTIRMLLDIDQFYYGGSQPLANQMRLGQFSSRKIIASYVVKNPGTNSIIMNENIYDNGTASYHNYVADKVAKPSRIEFIIGDTSKPTQFPGVIDYISSGSLPFVNRHGKQLRTTYTIDFQPGTTNVQVTPS